MYFLVNLNPFNLMVKWAQFILAHLKKYNRYYTSGIILQKR